MSEAPLPPAPVLDGELILDVFTHPSLHLEGGHDNERYTILGEQALQTAVTHAIFLRFPNYRREEIEEARAKHLVDESYERWTTHYRLREKLRYNPTVSEDVRSSQGARDLFHAYVGGAFSQANGPIIVNTWIHNLIMPQEAHLLMKEEPTLFHPPPPSVPYPMPPPPPPGMPTVPRSRTNSVSSRQGPTGYEEVNPYATTTTGKIVYLPRFNEACTQRRLNVQYPAEQNGLQHAPRWVVSCIVDGQHRGQGTATTKQLAKEEAAKQAWLTFGWGLRESR